MSSRTMLGMGLFTLGVLVVALLPWKVDGPSTPTSAMQAPVVSAPKAAAASARLAAVATGPSGDSASAGMAVRPSGSTLAAGSAAPAGVTPEQWQQVRAALADHPQREAEMVRLGDYLAFQNDFDRFRQLRGSVSVTSPELVQLARSLDAALTIRLQRQELQAGEARLVKMALLEVLEPDASVRTTALAAWAAAGAAMALAQDHVDPREAAFLTQQQAVVAAWQQLPAAQRDAQGLQTQLEALRNRIFAEPAR